MARVAVRDSRCTNPGLKLSLRFTTLWSTSGFVLARLFQSKRSPSESLLLVFSKHMDGLTTLSQEAEKRIGMGSQDQRALSTNQIKQTMPEDKGKPVEGITDVDVYCGRDKRTHAHPGNKRFRELITSHRESYQTATLRENKTKITSDIIETVHSYGGRFLKLDEETGQWFEVDSAYTHDKVSHALRSAKDPERPRVSRRRPVKIEEPTPAEEAAFQRLLATQEQCYSELLQQKKSAKTYHTE